MDNELKKDEAEMKANEADPVVVEGPRAVAEEVEGADFPCPVCDGTDDQVELEH